MPIKINEHEMHYIWVITFVLLYSEVRLWKARWSGKLLHCPLH